MGAKKTRFVVRMEGRELELFSVTENRAGGLTVILPIQAQSSPIHVADVDHRFSIHESLNTHDGGFQITETILRSDGKSLKNYAYVRPNNESAMLPAFARVSVSLRLAPDVSQKKRNATVVLYDEFAGGPVFFVVVASRNELEKQYFPSTMKLTSRSFKRYHLYVCSGVFHSVAMGSALTRKIMTHGPAHNGIKSKISHSVKVPEPLSPEPHQISFMIEEAVDGLSTYMKMAAGSFTWDDGPPTGEQRLSAIMGFDRYSAYPGSRSSTHIPRAREHRLAHPPTGLWLPPEGAEWRYDFPESAYANPGRQNQE